MIIRRALNQAREMLSRHRDIENPDLESEVLLRHILRIDRVQLLLDREKELDPGKEEEFQHFIERRLKDEPLAYIIRHREFFGLDFYVDERVLIPRPETEHLVEEAIKCAKEKGVSTIADIGTGSGAIAVSLAIYLSQVKIFATDISAEALEVARCNSQKHSVRDRITLLQGDLLDPLPTPVEIIIANLPYVKNTEVAMMPSARFEPPLALEGGEKGLEQIKRLSLQARDKLQRGGCLLLEVGTAQSEDVNGLLRKLYPSSAIEVIPDLAGIKRVVKLLLKD